MRNIATITNLLEYDETSPSCLRWKVDRYCGNNHNRLRVAAGDSAGYLEKNGYWRVTLGKVRYAAHQIIYYMFHGYLPTMVDHIDGDSLNNKHINLRDSNSVSNMRNRKRDNRNKSGVNGVNLYIKEVNGKVYAYWRATWSGLDKNAGEKFFSIDKYGNDVAFELACSHRAAVIEEMNEQGAGYSDRHGRWRDEDDL